MKTLIFLLSLSAIVALNPSPQQKNKSAKRQAEIKQAADSTEYELLVFDPGFEAYLAKLPYSKDFYTNQYYKNWNIRYVTEWNIRALNPSRYGTFYETQIDYNPQIDYGIDLNFKLYTYFQFIQDKYGIVLIKRR